MPVLDPNPFWETCDELFEDSGVVYEYGHHREYTRKHLVKVKDKSMGPVAVALCPLLPKPGSSYIHSGDLPQAIPAEWDRLAIMTRQSAARKSQDAGEWPWWIVTSEYSTQLPNRQDFPEKNQDKPEEDLAEVSWDFETAHEARPFDLDGNAYLNRARQPFSPPYTMEIDYPTVTISRNELNYDFNKATAYARGVNDATFLGAPPNCVQVLPPKANQKVIGRLRYWRVTYKLKFRPKQKNGGYTIPLIQIFRQITNAGSPDFGKWTGSGYMEFVTATLPNDVDSDGNLLLGPDGKPLKFWKKFPAPIDMPDSWQPTILNSGFFRIGEKGRDMDSVVGKPVPIFRHGHLIHSPALLGPDGQELVLPDDPLETMGAWYIRFHVFRTVSIASLLVKGLG